MVCAVDVRADDVDAGRRQDVRAADVNAGRRQDERADDDVHAPAFAFCVTCKCIVVR